MSFIWAIMSRFWTIGSEVMSKWGLLRYSLAVLRVFLD